jgi:ABC-type transport system involved in multi-copper enzyme maturation permease subunit
MALLRISLLKLVKRPASWIVLAVLLGLIAMVFLGLAASASQLTDPTDQLQVRLLLGFPNAYTALVGIILSLGGLLAVMFAAAIIGAEWAWGTIRSVIARGESRVRFTIITFIAIALVIGVGVIVAFGVGALMAIVAAEMAGIGSQGANEPDTLSGIPELLARTWLGVTEQAAIGFAIAMLFRSQLAGIGAGLAFYFGEIFLALVPIANEVLPYFPFNVANAVVSTADGFGDGGFGSTTSIDSDTAILWAVGYLVIALAVASLAAWRAQITQ